MDNLHNPIMNSIHFTAHLADNKLWVSVGLKHWVLYCLKEKFCTYGIGWKSSHGMSHPKHPLCLLVLCFLQNSVRLGSAKMTYVSTQHRVPTAEGAGSCHAGLAQRHCIEHQANEFALPGAIWALLKRFCLENSVSLGKCRSWSHQNLSCGIFWCPLKHTCSAAIRSQFNHWKCCVWHYWTLPSSRAQGCNLLEVQHQFTSPEDVTQGNCPHLQLPFWNIWTML